MQTKHAAAVAPSSPPPHRPKTPPPAAADPGVTFDTLFAGGLSPVSINELQLVSHTTQLSEGEEQRVLRVRHLVLCGRAVVQHTGADQPAAFAGRSVARLHIQDATGEDLAILVMDAEVKGRSAAAFAEEVERRFPPGTAVAVQGFALLVRGESFVCVVDLAAPGTEIHRLGSVGLPPVQLSQVRAALRCASEPLSQTAQHQNFAVL